MTFFFLFLYLSALQIEQSFVRSIKKLQPSAHPKNEVNKYDIEEYAGVFLPCFLKSSPLVYFQIQTPPTTEEIQLISDQLNAQFPDHSFSTLDLIWLLRDAFDNVNLQFLQEALSKNIVKNSIALSSIVLKEELDILSKLQIIYFKKLCFRSNLNWNELQHLWDIVDAQKSQENVFSIYNFSTNKEKKLLQGKNLQITLFATQQGWQQQQKLFSFIQQSKGTNLNFEFK